MTIAVGTDELVFTPKIIKKCVKTAELCSTSSIQANVA